MAKHLSEGDFRAPESEREQLKPCPFCGAPAKLEILGGPESLFRIVKCSKCRCDLHWWPTVELAIEAWNKRI